WDLFWSGSVFPTWFPSCLDQRGSTGQAPAQESPLLQPLDILGFCWATSYWNFSFLLRPAGSAVAGYCFWIDHRKQRPPCGYRSIKSLRRLYGPGWFLWPSETGGYWSDHRISSTTADRNSSHFCSGCYGVDRVVWSEIIWESICRLEPADS